MKTAEEWMSEPSITFATNESTLNAIRFIQKDAELAGWKRGMTEAAEITQHNQNFDNSIPEVVMIQSQIFLKKAILSKRDEKGGE